MRFLVDESCDFGVVMALRAAGHDVAAVAEVARSASDDVVIELGLRRGRILLTEDKDFGRWVYADHRATGGVIFIRFPAGARRAMINGVVELVRHHSNRLTGSFVVVEPGRIRIGRRPSRAIRRPARSKKRKKR